ncbi:MAG TPA: DUF1266 domain-containing protein [Polyangiaceae bacterium]|jgi:hypothetical protein|nr:DUF1266 domain-containing protein [Polyangiaceae bacterium]
MQILNPVIVAPIVAVVVVIGGIVFALIQRALSKGKEQRVERWAQAAYALWTGGEDSATWNRERAQNSLSSWYGADSSKKFFDVIDELRSGQTGNAAWDQVRALDLLRIGRAADYVDDEDCRKHIAKIGATLQTTYRSWPELAQAFEAGMNAWQDQRGITDQNQRGRVQRNLPKLQRELWPKIDYGASLTLED